MNTQNPAMGSAQPSPGITQQDISGLREMMMGMPLAQLQQFAQAHMNDPNGGIIVGMASQIANAKKSAAAPQQPQGSVAQQAVAGIAPPQAAPQMAPQAAPQPQAAPAPQMLPENQGIAQLPTKNLEGMARGGIASYADGGSTSSNDGDSDSDDPANTGKYDPTTGMIPNMTADQAIAMGLPNALNYGPSMYYAKQGGIIGYAGGGQIGGHMDGGVRRFNTAGLTPNATSVSAGQFPTGASDIYSMTPEEVKQAASRSINRANYSTPPAYPPATPSPGFFSNLGSMFKAASPLLGAVGLASVQTPDEDAILAKSDPKYAAYLQQNNPDRWAQINGTDTKSALPSTGAGAGQGSRGIGALLPTGAEAGQGSRGVSTIVPSIDPKTKAPPKISDAKKEGTVASNQLNNLLSTSASGYTSLSKDDLDSAMNPQGMSSAQEMAKQSAEISADKDAAAKAQYKPISDQNAADRKRLDERMDNSPAMATMLAGLSMIKSGNPWEAIAQGAAKGLGQYGDEQKYFDSARRELNHADLQVQTALDARLNNNERDAQKYLEMAQASKESAVRNRLTGLQLQNTSQYQAGVLQNQGQELGLKQLLLPAQINALNAQAGASQAHGDYLKAVAAAAPTKQDTALFLKAQAFAQKDYEDWLKQQQSTGNSFNLTEDQLRAKQDEFLTKRLSLTNKNPSASATVAPTTLTPASTSGWNFMGGWGGH